MKTKKIVRIIYCLLLVSIFLLTFAGCSNGNTHTPSKQKTSKDDTSREAAEPSATGERLPTSPEEPAAEPTMISTDFSGYFNGLNGAAVLFNPGSNEYSVYNPQLAETQRSPCSTFKIISSLIGLEYGVIPLDNSLRPWSGEVFWKEDWNRDIDFEQAFRTSCIWYFRQVIDELGETVMQEELNRLQYGNRDISDWEGHLNNNNNNPSLTGFWVESSLKISAKEQTDVMERIFGSKSEYSLKSLERLKQAMLVTDETASPNPIYGKTGLGMTSGIVVDSWFTGFTETPEGNIYFCVYLGQTDGMEVSSAKAKEIAISIISDSYH